MNTALVSLSYLDGVDSLGNNRLERNQRYIDYYSKLKEKLGFEDIVLIDNASNLKSIANLSELTFAKPFNDGWFFSYEDFHMYRFNYHFRRLDIPNGYIYCWRGLYKLTDLFNDYDKLLVFDSDSFVVSSRLAKFIKECNSGWQSFWCPRHQFPESSMFILNKDSYHLLTEYTQAMPYEQRCKEGRLMERDLPFTNISKDFVIDRFGEETPPREQSKDMDAYLQANLSTELVFA